LQHKFEAGETEGIELSSSIDQLGAAVREDSEKLDSLNAQVKALGEDEQLSVASDLATQKAKHLTLRQKQEELGNSSQQQQLNLVEMQQHLAQYQQEIAQLSQEKQRLEGEIIPTLTSNAIAKRASVTQSKENANAIAKQPQFKIFLILSVQNKRELVRDTIS